MLQNEYLVAKIGVDRAENEPSKVSPKWGVLSGSFRGRDEDDPFFATPLPDASRGRAPPATPGAAAYATPDSVEANGNGSRIGFTAGLNLRASSFFEIDKIRKVDFRSSVI